MGEGTFVPEAAHVIGDVTLGEDCFVGMGAVVRGDYGTVVVGDRTSIQENVVIHARDGGLTEVGSDVQLGHGCVLHNCTVGDSAVIGLGAILSDHSTVGTWAIVGEGAVVRGAVPAGKVAVGIPAKVVADVTEEHKEEWGHYKRAYADLARRRYPEGLERLD